MAQAPKNSTLLLITAVAVVLAVSLPFCTARTDSEPSVSEYTPSVAQNSRSVTPPVTDSPLVFEEELASDEPMYIAKNFQGRIGVFSSASPFPFQVIDIYVKYLPEADQQLLEEGIPLYSQEELTRLCEDYGS
ncbi:MAG: hypothetical protein ACOX7F_05670 [Eubacteriales bacterium]